MAADGRTRDHLLGGLFLGLAVATKYNVGLGAVTLLVAHPLSIQGSSRGQSVRTHLPLA